MKSFITGAAALFLTACGVDKVEVNCPESGCIDVAPAPTPTPSPTPEAPKEEPKSDPVPQEPEPKDENEAITTTSVAKDHKVTFNFKVSIRRTLATDFCDDSIDSILDEDEVADEDHRWKCDDQVLDLPERDVFTSSSFPGTRSFQVNEETYKAYQATSGCSPDGTKALKCQVTDNYFEVFASKVTNIEEGYKDYFNVTWKVYFLPKFNF